jgi:hypothetical protein
MVELPKPSGVDPPRVAQADSIRLTEAVSTLRSGPGRDRAAEAIVDALDRMSGVGEDAEERYQEALEALRKNSGQVLDRLAELYRELPTDRHSDRWGVVQLVADLRDPAALPLIEQVLETPVPGDPPARDRPRNQSTPIVPSMGIAQEVLIRTTAIEALARIGRKGSLEAQDLLLKYAQHEVFSVRRAAVHGFLSCHPKDGRERLLGVLGERDQALLEIRVADVRDIPQPRVGEYRARADSNILPPDRPTTTGPKDSARTREDRSKEPAEREDGEGSG